MSRRHHRTQHGFSLIEAAVSLVLLGLISVVLWRFIETANQQQHVRQQQSLLSRADHALLGYSLSQHRLPCPASDTAGRENCASVATSGYLPYLTLGLPDQGAGRIRYGVLRAPGKINLTASITERTLKVLRATVDTNTGSTLSFTEDYAQDTWAQNFCLRLNGAMRLDGANLSDLLQTGAAAASGPRRLSAYALALPTGAGGFSAQQGDGSAASGPGFDAPRRAHDPTADDNILAVSPRTLWQRLRCGDLVAATARAHPNIALSAGVLRQATYDYAEQLGLILELADIATMSAAAEALVSVASIATAAGELSEAMGGAITSYGVGTGAVIGAGIALAQAILGTALSVTATGLAAAAQVDARINRDAVRCSSSNPTETISLCGQIRGLYTDINTNVDTTLRAGGTRYVN